MLAGSFEAYLGAEVGRQGRFRVLGACQDAYRADSLEAYRVDSSEAYRADSSEAFRVDCEGPYRADYLGAYRVERETYRAVRSGFGLAFLEKQACLGLEAYRAFFRDQVAYRGLEPFLDLGAYRVWGPFLKRFEILIVS